MGGQRLGVGVENDYGISLATLGVDYIVPPWRGYHLVLNRLDICSGNILGSLSVCDVFSRALGGLKECLIHHHNDSAQQCFLVKNLTSQIQWALALGNHWPHPVPYSQQATSLTTSWNGLLKMQLQDCVSQCSIAVRDTVTAANLLKENN